ncbi:MAG: sodium:proton antiporter [Ktedonobacteraceae bacterium]|nr:sodium:proton antiporter [Ktedonobacteraceae bacterium]
MIPLSLLIRDLVLFLALALLVNVLTSKLALPETLGLVIVGLLIGLLEITPEAQLSPDLVLFVFLPALLFEGAWNTNLALLKENWRVIFFLAGPGLLLSLGVIAAMLHVLDQLDWTTSLLLAAILSPTDPIAVLALFRQIRVKERLSNIIEGESLFNDGVAGSLFQTFLALALLSTHGQAPTGLAAVGNGFLLFVEEAGGGLVLGLMVGFGMSQLLKRMDEPVRETTLTLIAAYGLYWVADALHLSAIIAVIVLGLLLGNYGRRIGMSERTRSHVDTFWRMLAFLANALIFLLIGVQIRPFAALLISGPVVATLGIVLVAIGVVLLARLVLILVLTAPAWLRLPRRANRSQAGALRRPPLPRSWLLILFWSGLRGALSLALVLALPLEVPARATLVVSTYAVVLFTLVIQGVSLHWVLARLLAHQRPSPTEPTAMETDAALEP